MSWGFGFGARVKVATVVRRIVMQAHSTTEKDYGPNVGQVRRVLSAKARYEWWPGGDRNIRFQGEPEEARGGHPYTEVPLDGEHIPKGYRLPGVHWPGSAIPIELVPGKYPGYDPDLVPEVPVNDWGMGGPPLVRLRRFPIPLTKALVIGRCRRMEGERHESTGRNTEDYWPGALIVQRVVPLYVVALETDGLFNPALALEVDLA